MTPSLLPTAEEKLVPLLKPAGKVAKNAFWTLVATGLTTCVAFVTGVLLPRVVGATAIGEYSYVMWLAAWMGTLSQGGVTQATQRYVAELWAQAKHSEAKTLALSITKIQAGCTLFLGACLLAFSKLQGASDYHLYLLALACFSSGILTIAGTLVSAVNGTESFDKTSKAGLPSTLIGGILLLLALNNGAGITQVLQLGALATAAWAIIQAKVFFNTFKSAPLRHMPPGLVPPASLFFYSLGFFLCTVVTGIVLNKGELLLLQNYCGDTAVGVYSVAINVSQKISVFPCTLAMVMVPTVTAKLATGDLKTAASIYDWTVRAYALLLVPVAVIAACLAEPLLQLLYGDGFEAAVLPFRISCISSLTLCLIMPALTNIYSQKWLGKILFARLLIPVFIDVVMSIFLIPLWGAIGASVAAAAAQIALAIVLSQHVSAYFNYKPPSTFLLKLAACFAFSLFTCMFASTFLQWQPVSRWLASAAFTLIIYVTSVYVLRCFTEQEIKSLVRASYGSFGHFRRQISEKIGSTG